MQQVITDDLDIFLGALPTHISGALRERDDNHELLEVVMDLGRAPEARYATSQAILSSREVTAEDLDYVVSRIGVFGEDNRAGIERTLHRFSAIRNRAGRIIGLSCRVGRAVFGNIRLIQDLVESGKNIMLLGRPGVGKTTMLREVARVLAGELEKRVVIVDTSNEIAGDGDIPHPAIGRARRMQVRSPSMQHAVMIEAVENHMPEVIIVDEMSTELEAQASRTIAERGVELVATAHGNTLENLILNPTLSDLIGGIQTVTLSDEEAKRRRTQKSILERKAPPTFDAIVEIQSWNRVAIHPDVASVVDSTLRGRKTEVDVRWFDDDGEVRQERQMPSHSSHEASVFGRRPTTESGTKRVFLFGIDRGRLAKTVGKLQVPVTLVDSLRDAELLMITKSHYRKSPEVLDIASSAGIPVCVLRSNSFSQMEQSLGEIFGLHEPIDPVALALREAEEAIRDVKEGRESLQLRPQNSYVRRLQHQLVQASNLRSESTGREPRRRLRVFRMPG